MQKSATVKQPFEVNWAGSIPFKQSLDFQEKLKVLAKKSQFCFFGFEVTEPVITLGLRVMSLIFYLMTVNLSRMDYQS